MTTYQKIQTTNRAIAQVWPDTYELVAVEVLSRNGVVVVFREGGFTRTLPTVSFDRLYPTPNTFASQYEAHAGAKALGLHTISDDSALDADDNLYLLDGPTVAWGTVSTGPYIWVAADL